MRTTGDERERRQCNICCCFYSGALPQLFPNAVWGLTSGFVQLKFSVESGLLSPFLRYVLCVGTRFYVARFNAFSPHGSVSRYFSTRGELLVYRMCWSGRLFRADEYSHVGAYVASLLCRFFDTLGVFPLPCLIDACDACLSIGVYRERVTSQRER